MNQEKRQFFKGLKLQIGISELTPYFCPLIPQNEFIYRIDYLDSLRGNSYTEQIHFNPPLLPSELNATPRQHIRDLHIVNISEEQLKIYTKMVKKISNGYASVDNTYAFSIFDLIDP
jgi:hypothetical protein